jgi:LuxR family transcriptional regulator, maltose regulon positive regulatory protein
MTLEAKQYPVEIFCLGGFAIKINGDNLRTGAGKAQRKPLELLWSLIVVNGRGLLLDLLADRLWPDLDGDRAGHALRTTIYRLRKLIGSEAIVQEDNHVRLETHYVATDLGRLWTALAQMRDQQLPEADRLSALDQALRLYRGPLLPGIGLDNVAEERERLANVLVNEALSFLLGLDHTSPAVALRVHRLRTLVPSMKLPEALNQLWSN